MPATPPPWKVSTAQRNWLDVLRAGAALYVVAHHLGQHAGLEGGARLLLSFGQEAVMAFFLLSGFVVFANEENRVADLGGYAWRRIRRIYPPLLAAMLVSALVAAAAGDMASALDWKRALGTLFAMQDASGLKPGVIIGPYGGNAPLWSLSYEVAFYALFPAVMALLRKNPANTGHVVGAVCGLLHASYFIYPNHFSLVGSYFAIWWTGAMCAHALRHGDRRTERFTAAIIWLFLIAAIAGLATVIKGFAGPGVHPALMLRHFATAAVMAPLLLVLLRRAGGPPPAVIRRPAAFLASISYGIYILHYPLLIQWSEAPGYPGLFGATLLLAALSWLSDRRLLEWMRRVGPRSTARAAGT